jgi:hypothetical protein
MERVELPFSMYLLMFLQLLMTGYIALMLRDGIITYLI